MEPCGQELELQYLETRLLVPVESITPVEVRQSLWLGRDTPTEAVYKDMHPQTVWQLHIKQIKAKYELDLYFVSECCS